MAPSNILVAAENDLCMACNGRCNTSVSARGLCSKAAGWRLTSSNESLLPKKCTRTISPPVLMSKNGNSMADAPTQEVQEDLGSSKGRMEGGVHITEEGAATTRSTRNILNLPDECMLVIFAHLFAPQGKVGGRMQTRANSTAAQAFTCAPVCRRWRNLVQESVQRLDLRGRNVCSHVLISLGRLWNLRSLTVQYCSLPVPDTLLEVVGSKCPLLVSASFFTLSAGFSSNGLHMLAKGCPSLQNLVLDNVLQPGADASAFLEMKSLRHLMLRSHTEIKGLARALESMDKLQKLSLVDMKHLWALPAGFARLSSLQELIVASCPISELPESFGYLPSLKRLQLAAIPLQRLPSSFGNLATLEDLVLESLQFPLSADWLPPSLANMRGLRRLRVWECWGASCLPPSLGSIPALHCLELGASHGAWNLKALPDSIGALSSLRKLHLNRITGLTELPNSIGALQDLQELRLNDCQKLRRLPPELCLLKSLDTLEILGSSSLTELPDNLGALESLRQLSIQNCNSIRTLPSSTGHLSTLRTLDVHGCAAFEHLPPSIGDLAALHSLMIRWCPNFVELPTALGHLRNLQMLKLDGCCMLASLPSTLDLSSLASLSCESCPMLQAKME